MFGIAEQLGREKKDAEALNYLFRVFILDLSGLGNGIFLDSPYSIVVAPGIIFRIQDHAKRLNMDEASLKELFSEAWSRIRPKLPFHYLDEQTSFECLLATFDNEQDYEKYIRKVIEKAYKALDKNELRRKGLKVFERFRE